jgi:hypothetical protein
MCRQRHHKARSFRHIFTTKHALRHCKARRSSPQSTQGRGSWPFELRTVTSKHADRHHEARGRHQKARSKSRIYGCCSIFVILLNAKGGTWQAEPKENAEHSVDGFGFCASLKAIE